MTRDTILSVDLDSTLADTGHRHRIIDPQGGTDWVAYSMACEDDRLIESTATLVRLLADTHEIHYVTGRASSARELTIGWLDRHNMPMDGLWMDETPNEDHVIAYGSHALYKVARVKQVEQETGKPVALHIDDWSSVKVALEEAGIPCLCVRTPQEVLDLAG